MFDLSHEELSDAEKAGSRRDFVAIGLSDTGRREWHRTLVVIEQFLEIQELALRRLGSEVNWRRGTWPNG
jgi:hypothetical protein